MIRSLEYEKNPSPLSGTDSAEFKVVWSRKKERRENSDSFFRKLLET